MDIDIRSYKTVYVDGHKLRPHKSNKDDWAERMIFTDENYCYKFSFQKHSICNRNQSQSEYLNWERYKDDYFVSKFLVPVLDYWEGIYNKEWVSVVKVPKLKFTKRNIEKHFDSESIEDVIHIMDLKDVDIGTPINCAVMSDGKLLIYDYAL